MSYMAENELPSNIREQDTLKAYSTETIPYLFRDDHDFEVFNGYVSNQRKYPTELSPKHDDSKRCIHNNEFSKELIKLIQ